MEIFRIRRPAVAARAAFGLAAEFEIGKSAHNEWAEAVELPMDVKIASGIMCFDSMLRFDRAMRKSFHTIRDDNDFRRGSLPAEEV